MAEWDVQMNTASKYEHRGAVISSSYQKLLGGIGGVDLTLDWGLTLGIDVESRIVVGSRIDDETGNRYSLPELRFVVSFWVMQSRINLGMSSSVRHDRLKYDTGWAAQNAGQVAGRQ